MISAGDNLSTGSHAVHMGNKYITCYTIAGKVKCNGVFSWFSRWFSSLAGCKENYTNHTDDKTFKSFHKMLLFYFLEQLYYSVKKKRSKNRRPSVLFLLFIKRKCFPCLLKQFSIYFFNVIFLLFNILFDYFIKFFFLDKSITSAG